MKHNEQISRAVNATLDQYFTDLDGEAPQAVYDMVLACVEKPMLEYIMQRAQGNQTRAADILGINRNTLRKKLQDYNLL